MAQPNPSGNAVLAQPEGFMEMLMLLTQNLTLLSVLQPLLSALQLSLSVTNTVSYLKDITHLPRNS